MIPPVFGDVENPEVVGGEQSGEFVLEKVEAISDHHTVSEKLIPTYLQDHLKEQVQVYMNSLKKERQDLLKLGLLIHPPLGSEGRSRPTMHLTTYLTTLETFI